jgi:hypothetical protein
MSRKFGELGDELVSVLEHAYVIDGLGYAEISGLSEQLIGQQVSEQTVYNYAVKGRWDTLRARHAYGKDGLPGTIEEEVADIRQIVYDAIVRPDERPSARDLASLVSAYTSLKGAGASIMGAGKTSREKVLDLILEQEAQKGEQDE